ncbi:hypothetical protein PRJBM_00030 [Bartonella henselae]|nr:hypothetical protein Q654_00700 [Bartonella henselae JK 50]ETS09459.1 hypothetical protein Q655_00648 [Bartonella henselae JK 51]ETS09651.1 hypothetical protein Q653_00724 [Bartonella henselae JK 42]ETS12679.1 hypothetical protein Q652_00854 [Bartonella henselae JK 41]CDO39429.1 hypothetical protein PRJBM_00030 [Bartonella henselae]
MLTNLYHDGVRKGYNKPLCTTPSYTQASTVSFSLPAQNVATAFILKRFIRGIFIPCLYSFLPTRQSRL